MTNSRPTHAEVTQSNRRAQAPYNFVPLPETVLTVENLPPHNVYHGYSGYLNCTLKTLTPFYTRCMMNPDFFKEWGETAFYDLPPDKQEERVKPSVFLDVPVISGSSLRGMVRNLVEIVGYGKMAWVTDQLLSFRSVDTTNLGEYYRGRIVKDEGKRKVVKPSKRRGKIAIHSTPLVQAGYLEKQKGKWAIRPSQNIGGVTFARILEDKIPQNLSNWHNYQNAYKIWVKLGKYDYQDVKGGFIQLKYTPVLDATASQQSGYQEAVLVYSGEMDKKKHEAIIFPPDPNVMPIDLDDKLIDAYEAQISQEQEKLLGEQGALNPDQPVFYLIENKELVFFGHVMMFRLPYPNTPLDFVPEDLRDPTQTDLAEAIFGYVEGKGDRDQAYAGRVFFGDARFETPAPDGVWKYQQPITPQALSGPKPTTFQHYLTQDDPNDKKNLNHYATSPNKTTIRGHKQYWHRGETGLDDIEEKDQDKLDKSKKQYTRIQPVKPDVTFRFKIHFENLNETELGLLLWVLDLPQGHHHKLGMGKPLGLGSVAISPELYLCNRQKRYTDLFTETGDGWKTGFDQPILKTAPSPNDLSLESLKNSFEQAMMTHLKQAGVSAQGSFHEQDRIQSLLKLLEWPGPDRKSTEYMTIQPNQFKERPVLPEPLDYDPSSPPRQEKASPTPRNQPRTSSQKAQQSQPQKPSTPIETEPEAAPSQKPPPAADPIKIPEVGDIFTDEIVRISSKGDIVVKYKGLPAGRVYVSIPAESAGGKQYQVGQNARCEVVEKYQEEGGWVLVCKPGPKPSKKAN